MQHHVRNSKINPHHKITLSQAYKILIDRSNYEVLTLLHKWIKDNGGHPMEEEMLKEEALEFKAVAKASLFASKLRRKASNNDAKNDDEDDTEQETTTNNNNNNSNKEDEKSDNQNEDDDNMADHEIHKLGKDSTAFKEHLHEHFFFFNSDNDELDESDAHTEDENMELNEIAWGYFIRMDIQHIHRVEHQLFAQIREETFFADLPLLGALGKEDAEEFKANCIEAFDVKTDIKAVVKADGMISENIAKKCKNLAKRCTSIENMKEACMYVLGQDLFYATQHFSTNIGKMMRRIENEYNNEDNSIRVTQKMRENIHKLAFERSKGEYIKCVESTKDMICWNNPTFDGYTALHMAAANGDADTFGILLNYLDGRDPFVENDFGETPLHIAAQTADKGAKNVVERIMQWVEKNQTGDRKYYNAIKRRTYPRLEYSHTERDDGDGRLIRDDAGEIKPFGFEHLHGTNHVNGGKTANAIAKEEFNFDMVNQFHDWRELDVDHEDLKDVRTTGWICCSPKRSKRLIAAAFDF